MNKKAIYSFLISFLLLIAVIVIDRKAFNNMREYIEWVDHSREVIISFEQVSNYFKSAQIYSPAYAAQDRNLFELYQQEMENVQKEIWHLQSLVKDDSLQVKRTDSIAAFIVKHIETLKTKGIGQLVEPSESWRLHDFFLVHSLINRGVAHEQSLLQARERELHSSTELTSNLTIAFSIIAAGVIIATFISNLFLSRKRKWLEGFLESILDTSQGGIITYRSVRKKGKIIDFKVEFANKAIEKLLGIDPADLLGRKLSGFTGVLQGPELLERFTAVAESGKQDEFEIFYDNNNIRRWFCVLLAKLNDGLIASFHDISELKQSQEELRNNISKLQESNVELEQYAYAASHDLQEPLRKIRLYATHLQDKQKDKLDERGKQDIEKILGSAERMTNLITDLLGFSSVKKEALFAPTDLNQILRNVLEDLDLLVIQQKAIIDVSPLPVIEAIALQMNQLFYNLLNNALKFARKDKQLTVKITCKQLTQQEVARFPKLNSKLQFIEIVVADNGMGFNEEFAEQIFGLFKRLGDKQQYPGSGIGLALCRKVVDNHKGVIFAHAKENEGASFHIILPVKQATA